jgi:hypothetical protein
MFCLWLHGLNVRGVRVVAWQVRPQLRIAAHQYKVLGIHINLFLKIIYNSI